MPRKHCRLTLPKKKTDERKTTTTYKRLRPAQKRTTHQCNISILHLRLISRRRVLSQNLACGWLCSGISAACGVVNRRYLPAFSCIPSSYTAHRVVDSSFKVQGTIPKNMKFHFATSLLLWTTTITSISLIVQAFVVPTTTRTTTTSSASTLRPLAAVGLLNPDDNESSSSSSSSSSSWTTSALVDAAEDVISAQHPLRVMIAGAGVGGLALANDLCVQSVKNNDVPIQVTVLEQASAFKRFGGPIQLASNAMQILRDMDADLYEKIAAKFTVTGDKKNGIKDGIRTEWYAEFDLKSPAEQRNMPYTGVIDRPDLQQIYLDALPDGTVQNGDGVVSYEHLPNGSIKAVLESGKEVYGDVLIGADGIWSAVRATMRDAPRRGDESGVTYSGYTLYAGELKYQSPDNGQVGYKVYIGPGQYFVITDIGKGMYQWYAFLGRPPNSADADDKPDGTSQYLQEIFAGWSHEIHDILKVTAEDEIEQRDLYDRPPSMMKPWVDGRVALMGDGVHAMMPNLGQGGCQAIEDAYVLSQELRSATKRSQVKDRLEHYQRRRLIRSAAVQGLSRFASDIIIRGFDTPAKVYRSEETGKWVFENFNYAGIVTKMLQPILPIFFVVQFNFLYDGWRNEQEVDLKSAVAFGVLGTVILFLLAGSIAEAGVGMGIAAEALLGGELALDFEAIAAGLREFFNLSV